MIRPCGFDKASGKTYANHKWGMGSGLFAKCLRCGFSKSQLTIKEDEPTEKRYQVNIKDGKPIMLEFNVRMPRHDNTEAYPGRSCESDSPIPWPFNQAPSNNYSGMATNSNGPPRISKLVLDDITRSSPEEAWKAFEEVIGAYQRELERKLEQAKEWAWAIP